MPSFDVVSRVDFQEIDNAIANALREISNRYDFKGSNTSLERNEKLITIPICSKWQHLSICQSFNKQNRKIDDLKKIYRKC